MKYLSITLLTITALSIFLWTSCDKQTCENIVCPGNNTACYAGQCGCVQGYEGPNCDTYSYEKYIGNYQVSENCTTSTGSNQPFPYNMYITLGSRVDRIVINNFMGIGSVEAYINNNDLSIPSQTIGATTIEGYGSFFPEIRQLKLEYQYTQGSQFGQCTAIMGKI